MKVRAPLLCLIVLGFAAACGFRPDAHMAAARQALTDARFDGAETKCPDLFQEAVRHMNLAEEAYRAGDEKKALIEAQGAERAAWSARECVGSENLPSMREQGRKRPFPAPPPPPRPPIP